METTLDNSLEGNWLCVEQFLMELIRKVSSNSELNESELKRANAQAIVEALHTIEKVLRRKFGHNDVTLNYKQPDEIIQGVVRCKIPLFDELLRMQSVEQSTTLVSLAAAIEYILVSVNKMTIVEAKRTTVLEEYNNTHKY